MVSFKSNVFPYRMVLSRREPVQLSVEMKNDSAEQKLISLEISLPRNLGFDKSGLKTREVIKIGNMIANEEKKLYFDIFPKAATEAMEYPVDIMVLEHYKDYNNVNRRQSKQVTIRVDK